MKAIVTGSLGFMGSHLVSYLVDKGWTVRGIDNLSTGFGVNTHYKAPTFKADLVTEPDLVAGIIEGFKPDYVFHLAAWAHEGLSQFCPIKVTENNYNATLNTLIPSIRAGVKRFIYTSSMSVYGGQQTPFDETMERKPVDIYGVSKAAGENAIEILSKVHDFEYTIIRPHNVYGPKQNLSDPYRNVAGIFIRRAILGQPLIIYGDGEQKRAFSYIDDVTPYLYQAAVSEEAKNQIINVGPDWEYKINQLADAVIAAVKSRLGLDIEKQYVPDRPLEVKDAWCTNQKAKDILGYETLYNLIQGIEIMFDWALHLHNTGKFSEPRYLDKLELVNERTPKTWRDKTL